MTFQALDKKGNHFLELLDDDDKPVKLMYSKDETWLKYFGYSNSLCVRVTRAIVNHAVICKFTRLENYIPAVMSPLKHTSLPSTAATFLTTHLMVVLQPSGYSVFHDGVTPIQLGLP